jgi:hypothetical protein
MQLNRDQNGQFRSPQSPQEWALTRYLWRLGTPLLLVYLTLRRNRHSKRFLRGDLDCLRAWLNEPDLESALATLFGNGHDAAVWLLLRHRDHMLDAGCAVTTVNRHLCTIRATARIARDMGKIGWDLADVPGISNSDNSLKMSGVAPLQNGGGGDERYDQAVETGLTIAPELEAELGCN